MANTRLILTVACTAGLASWLTALGGVVAATRYGCDDSIRGAAAHAGAGFSVLAAFALFLMVARAVAAQQKVVVLPTVTHAPRPLPLVSAIDQKALAVTSKDDEWAVAGSEMIGTGA
jgi:hypothetical protein